MKNNNAPRRKRRTREYRLGSSKEWIKNYEGKNIVKGYAKWYGVDLFCAIKELRMNGVIVGEEYEDKVRQSIEAKQLAKQMNEENRKERIIDSEDEFSDDRFAFITGYTSGSAAYGINHEEMRDYQEEKDEIDFNEIFKD
jgi:hypothetical protein